ncbi:MAG: S24/S26 family peptidase [Patescibacteria group bacterium]|nr:S24/S26 family peptidase [Patescibacteria group bacterium]
MKHSPQKTDLTGFSKEFYVVTLFILAVAVVIVFKYIPASRYQTFIGSGSSMEPTFFDGDELTVDTKISPAIGDAIIFDCVSCDGYTGDFALTKRIYKINLGGCYWLMGDNKEISYDSRISGWLCPDENIKVHGVVVDVKHAN